MSKKKVSSFESFEQYTTIRKMWAWTGVVLIVVIIPLLFLLRYQKIEIIKLQAHVSAVSEMNAECFSQIIK